MFISGGCTDVVRIIPRQANIPDAKLIKLVYVIESKGEHLIDNPDTQYKKIVFDRLNIANIESLNLNLARFKLNKRFQFELVEQGKEDADINRFFSQ